MKRIFTLLSTILVALTSYAQLEITDEAGKVIENGGTIEFKAEETDLGGGFVILDCAPTAPYLTNKGASSANLTVTVTPTEADKLTWCGITTTCLPMTTLQEVRSASLGAGQKTPLQLHADFESGQYATYTAEVTARLGSDTKKFTIKFVYADPAPASRARRPTRLSVTMVRLSNITPPVPPFSTCIPRLDASSRASASTVTAI